MNIQKPLNFLVVEDDDGVITAISLILKTLCNSVNITWAKSLAEARVVLAMSRSDGDTFDVAIIDGQLPDGDTTDGLIGEVREKFPTAHIVAFSGDPDIFAEQMKVCDSGVRKGTDSLVHGIKRVLEFLEDKRQKQRAPEPEAVAA